jgi:hypothetical protein
MKLLFWASTNIREIITSKAEEPSWDEDHTTNITWEGEGEE